MTTKLIDPPAENLAKPTVGDNAPITPPATLLNRYWQEAQRAKTPPAASQQQPRPTPRRVPYSQD